MEGQLARLQSELTSKDEELSSAQEEIIKLTERVTSLMSKDLHTVDADSLSLVSIGSFSESDSTEIQQLKEKLVKQKQNEEMLKMQLEALQGTLQVMVHPDDASKKEQELANRISELENHIQELLVTNMTLKERSSQFEEHESVLRRFKAEIAELHENDERKTAHIEKLSDQLHAYGEQNTVLLESLQETEQEEKTLRDSITRIRSATSLNETNELENLKRLEQSEHSLLQRLDSLEEKDTRLRDRLLQVEEHERKLEQELETWEVKNKAMAELLEQKLEELDVVKDISNSQELTIKQLQDELAAVVTREREHELECEISKLREENSSLLDSIQQRTDELQIAKDISSSQEETIKELQQQLDEAEEADLTSSYQDQLERELGNEDYEEEINQLKYDLEEAQKQIDLMKQGKVELQNMHASELSSMQRQLEQAHSEMDRSASKYKIAHNLIDELKAQNKTLTDTSATNDKQIKDLNMKLQAEKVQNTVHRDVIDSMSPQLDKLKCENEAQENMISKLQEKIKHYQASEAEFKAKREELSKMEAELIDSVQDEELIKVRQELENKKAESDNITVDLIEMTGKCDELDLKVQELDAERGQLEEQLSASINRERMLAESVEFHQHAKAELQSQVNKYFEQMNELTSAKHQLETKLANQQSELDAVRLDISEHKRLHSSELEQAKLNKNDLANKCTKLQDEFDLKVKELENLQKEMASSSTADDETHSALLLLQEEAATNADKLKQETLFRQEAEEQITLLNEKLAETCESCKENASIIDDLNQVLQCVRQDNAKLEEDNSNLVSQLKDQCSECSDKQAHILRLAEQIESLQTSIDKLEDQNSTLDLSLREEKELTELLQAKTEASEFDAQQLTMEANSLAETNRSLQEQLNDIKDRFESADTTNVSDSTEDENVQLGKLSNEVRMQMSMVEQYKQQLEEDNEKFASLMETNKTLVDQIDIDRKLHTLTVDQLNSSITEGKSEVNDVSKCLAQSLSDQKVLTTQLDEMESSNKSLCAELAASTSLINSLKTQLTTLQGQAEKLQKELVSTAKFTQENSKLKSEISQLTEQFDATTEQVDQKSAIMTKLAFDNSKLQQLLASLTSENQVLTSKLQNSEVAHGMALSKLELARQEETGVNYGQQLRNLEEDYLDLQSSAAAEVSILKAKIVNLEAEAEKLLKDPQLKEGLQKLTTQLQDRLRDEKLYTVELQKLIEEQTTKLASRQSELEEMKEKIESMECDYESTLTKLSHVQEALTESNHLRNEISHQYEEAKHHYSTNITTLEVDLKSLQADLDSVTGDLTITTESLALVKSNLETEKLQHQQTKERLEMSRGGLEEELEQESNLQEENLNLLNTISSLESSLCDVRKELQQKQDSVNEMANGLEDLQKEMAVLRERLHAANLNQEKETELEASLRQEVSDLQSQIEDQKLLHESLRADVMEFHESANVEVTDALKVENDQLHAELNSLQEVLNTAQDQNKELREKLGETAGILAVTTEEMKQFNSLKEQYQHLEEEKDRLQQNYEGLQARLAEFSFSQSENIVTVEELCEESQSTQERAEAQTSQLAEMQQKLDSAQQQASTRETENGNLPKETATLTENDHTQQINLLEQENTTLQERITALEFLLTDKEAQLIAIVEKIKAIEMSQSTSEQIAEAKTDSLIMENAQKEELCEKLNARIIQLEKKVNTPEISTKHDVCQAKLQQVQNQVEVLEFDCQSIETKLVESTEELNELKKEMSALKQERDRLVANIRASPRTDETNADGVEYIGLQKQIIELKQQLKQEKKNVEEMKAEKLGYLQKIQHEQDGTTAALAETEKLQMSLDLVMTSHKTEMTSLKRSLEKAEQHAASAEHCINSPEMSSRIAQLSHELSDIRVTKAEVTSLMNDFIAQNSIFMKQLQEQLNARVAHQVHDQSIDDHTSSMSITLPTDQPLNSTQMLTTSNTPSPTKVDAALNMSLSMRALGHPTVSPINTHSSMSRDAMVDKLSEQERQLVMMRKQLNDARQSLQFFRTAVDNIIDCLGDSMPDVKKWATDVLNSEDQAFSQHLDDLVQTESALQHKVHTLEMSEQALMENFETKEREYQSSIRSLEDMVSSLKTSKARLSEELKTKSSTVSLEGEERIAELKEKVYQLENTVKNLRLQNEELQYTLDREMERRQKIEEEKHKIEQRVRMSKLDSVREAEYQSKVVSLEQKIVNLMSVQRQLESTIDTLRYESPEDELKGHIEALERSERALQRKIEILQATDTRSSSLQYENTMDRPEDVLRQRIWELERMETHLKQQVSDLEHDREELHEIARSDKNIIHELNIQIAEAGLANKNLKTQIARFENAEEALLDKLDKAEAKMAELENICKETSESEKTLKYQLEDAEYSEDNLQFRTANMEKAIENLQANEIFLKKRIDEMLQEREFYSADGSSWKGKLQHHQNEQVELRTRVLDLENREIALKGKVSEMLSVESGLRMRLREVELDNEKQTSRILHLEKAAADVMINFTDSSLGNDELNSQIQNLRATEQVYKSKIAVLETEKFELEKNLQDKTFAQLQMKSQLTKDERDGTKISEKLSSALSAEQRSKSQVNKLEAMVAMYERKLTNGVTERENFQLTAENRQLKEKLKDREKQVTGLEGKVQSIIPVGGTATYRVKKLEEEILRLENRLRISEEKLQQAMQKEIEVQTVENTRAQGPLVESISLAEVPTQKKIGSQQLATVRKELPGNHRLHNASSNQPVDLRRQCLTELLETVRKKGQEVTEVADDVASEVTFGELEIESQNSIWEYLEPPVRKSPMLTTAAVLIKEPSACSTPIDRSCSSTPAEQLVPEESSLWEKLELYEPPKKTTNAATREIVFPEGPISPKYSPQKAHTPPLKVVADEIDNTLDSADEAPEIEDDIVSPAVLSTVSTGSSAYNLSGQQAVIALETKDIARLKQTITELERKLKSRDTEIKMLRNERKEIMRDTELSGDLFSMKTKLKSLIKQLETKEKLITSLRNDIASKDRSIDNRQREVVELRVELRKLQEQSPSTQNSADRSKSPGARQRPLQMSTSPARQTTIEKEPSELYKSMMESKDSHIKDLTLQLQEKKSAIERLNRELTDLKIRAPSPAPGVSPTSKFQYLDDKYTEAASRCFTMKLEKEEWKKKYEQLYAEHSKCSSTSRDCLKCKELEREIRKLTDALSKSSEKLTQKEAQLKLLIGLEQSSPSRNAASQRSNDTTASESDSLPEDVVDYILNTSSPIPHQQGSSSQSNSGNTTPVLSPSPEQNSSPTRIRVCKKQKSFKPLYYDVVSDYNPQYFSTSGKLSQEVPLKEGQRIRILSAADGAGYCQAEVNGRIHLVPMKYLKSVDLETIEMEKMIKKRKQRLSQLSRMAVTPDKVTTTDATYHTTNGSTKHETRSSRHMYAVKPTNSNNKLTPVRVSVSPPKKYIKVSKKSGKPAAPSDVTVEIVANEKMYVEWTYMPYLDDMTKSNGTVVTGFRVFLNGRSTMEINSPCTTVAVIDITPSQAAEIHTVSVQAVGVNGVNSSLTHAVVSVPLDSSDGCANNSTSRRNKLQNNSIANGTKKLYMAYYDYDPIKQGPYSRGKKKSYKDELPIKTGDLLVVHGDPAPDGFVLAEIDGIRGYVPESFIRQVPSENAQHYGFFDNDARLP